jgi:hypothetical protein
MLRWSLTVIQVLLESHKYPPDRLGRPEVRNSILYGIVISQLEQRRQLLLIQFPHALLDVLPQHKLDELLLLVVKLVVQSVPGGTGSASRVTGGMAKAT